jgi:putative heme-binding domain-containing protein
MTPFGELLDDDELAAVLTYVRNSFGNTASDITAQKIAEVRVATQSKIGFYSPEELEGGAGTAGRPFVKMWSLDDFPSDFDRPLRGRSFSRGREMFEVASCATCHNIQGKGGNVGADLTNVGERYQGADLLLQILDPSAQIKDEHRVFTVELPDDVFYQGLIVDQDADAIQLAERLQRPEETIEIARGEILRMSPLDVSPMPSGLLVTLSRDEILDLVAYITSGGDERDAAFSR